jgi:hypothetical protein
MLRVLLTERSEREKNSMAFGGPGGGPPFDPLNGTGRVQIPGFVDDDDDPPFGGQNVEGGEAANDLLATVQSSYINDGAFRDALARLVINDQRALENQQLEVIMKGGSST